jgi:adenosine kinase
LMGSIKIASQGPQNHHLSQEAIQMQFKQVFGYSY